MNPLVLGAVIATGSPLDDFLNRSDATADRAEVVRDVGVTMSMLGLLIAIGVVVFLARVHRGPAREVRSLLTMAGFGGVLTLVGGIVELSGIESVFGTGWSDVLTVEVSSAAMLRVIGGVLVVFGLGEATVEAGGEATLRWTPGPDSAFGLVGLAVAALSFSFDGHTVTEGPRGVHVIADLVHVTAAGVWFGGLAALVAVAALRHRGGGSIAELIVRFSSVATVALAAVAGAGGVMALLILDDVAELTGTVWGRRLTVKLVAVGVATLLGAYHHLVTVRRLDRPGGPDPVELARARTTLVVEAMVLAFVVLATGFLVNGSTA